MGHGFDMAHYGHKELVSLRELFARKGTFDHWHKVHWFLYEMLSQGMASSETGELVAPDWQPKKCQKSYGQFRMKQ